MIGMGFVETWDTLAGLRVILGLLEAGFFPGKLQYDGGSSWPLSSADHRSQAASIS